MIELNIEKLSNTNKPCVLELNTCDGVKTFKGYISHKEHESEHLHFKGDFTLNCNNKIYTFYGKDFKPFLFSNNMVYSLNEMNIISALLFRGI